LRSHARKIRRPSALLAYALSVLWPGSGQLYLGDRRTAALLALPPIVLFIPLLIALSGGIEGLVGYLVVPRNALVVAIAATTSLVLRLVSLWLVRVRTGSPAREHRGLVAIAGVVAILHLTVAFASFSLFGTTSRVFSGTLGRPTTPAASQASPDVGALPSPIPEPPDEDERLSVLLVGSDYGTGYSHSLTDSMMVVSVDPKTGDVAMVSVPRDTARFELYSGGIFQGKINSLMSKAAADPERYPDGGLGTLANQISYLIGIPIQYVAYINMGAFEKMIDAVGGIDVNVTKAINDSFYQFPNGGPKGFRLSVGPHHLDGAHATAYVRSRYGPGDNDFTRARRQQEVLVALRAKLTSPAVLPNLPAVLDQLGQLVSTNFPPERIGEAIELSRQVDEESMKRTVLGPPYAVRPPDAADYILVPDMERIAAWSVKTFGDASRYATDQG
jgi:LCP family protein required for cell wall assembly